MAATTVHCTSRATNPQCFLKEAEQIGQATAGLAFRDWVRSRGA